MHLYSKCNLGAADRVVVIKAAGHMAEYCSVLLQSVEGDTNLLLNFTHQREWTFKCTFE